jgi:PAS domain S-box-containing protein
VNRLSARLPWDRADAWLGLGSMLMVIVLAKVSSFFGSISFTAKALTLFAFLIQPYLLARVVRHYRPVSDRMLWLLLSGAAAIAVIASSLETRPVLLRYVTFTLLWGMQGVAGLALASAARRHAGLMAWRLWTAATGVLLYGILTAVTVLALPETPFSATGPVKGLLKTLPYLMLLASYVGLMPPGFLRRLLLRGEEYRFMRRTGERTPADRGDSVAGDLADAALRSVSSPLALVLTGRRPLAVTGASRAAWLGRAVRFTDHSPIGRCLATERPLTGDISELEDDLAEAAREAEQFVMVPVVAPGGRTWGVLFVTQRRRSLFIRDDIDSLSRLCRHAAEVLDHAQLLAEERARQQREAEARLDLILESLRDYAVLTTDATGRITSWNAGAAHVFGYSAGEIVGQSARMLFADGAPWLEEELARARAGEEPMVADTAGRRHDGSTLTASLVIRPLMEQGRETGGLVLVMRDVSAQRSLEEHLRQAQKLEAIGRLAGGVAHDFNNMLTVIIGYADGMRATATDEQADAVGEIRKAADHAATLTRQLLAFSRRQNLKPREIAIDQVVASMQPLVRRLVGEHIDVSDIVEPPVPPVFADPTQIEQIVMNLAANARDAMPEGGRIMFRVFGTTLTAPSSEALTGREGPHAVLEVADTGVGMDMETQARIFEPFFTTKEVGRGTGLGLATVYGLVQQMQGAITVDSRLGEGTRFRIYVPAHEPRP